MRQQGGAMRLDRDPRRGWYSRSQRPVARKAHSHNVVHFCRPSCTSRESAAYLALAQLLETRGIKASFRLRHSVERAGRRLHKFEEVQRGGGNSRSSGHGWRGACDLQQELELWGCRELQRGKHDLQSKWTWLRLRLGRCWQRWPARWMASCTQTRAIQGWTVPELRWWSSPEFSKIAQASQSCKSPLWVNASLN